MQRTTIRKRYRFCKKISCSFDHRLTNTVLHVVAKKTSKNTFSLGISLVHRKLWKHKRTLLRKNEIVLRTAPFSSLSSPGYENCFDKNSPRSTSRCFLPHKTNQHAIAGKLPRTPPHTSQPSFKRHSFETLHKNLETETMPHFPKHCRLQKPLTPNAKAAPSTGHQLCTTLVHQLPRPLTLPWEASPSSASNTSPIILP